MPELGFEIIGVEAVARGLTPLLHFRLQITAPAGAGSVHGVLLNAQVQLRCPERAYNAGEKERLFELFGAPERWGQTLRPRLWTHTSASVGPFEGSVETVLPVQCTWDLNLASAKYFYALESGDVPLLFLFSGSLFYATPEGRLQVERISWNAECRYLMPVAMWRDLMERHYPNSAWLTLRRDVFDELNAYKRRQGLATWEETVQRLLKEPSELSCAPQPSRPRHGSAVPIRNPEEVAA